MAAASLAAPPPAQAAADRLTITKTQDLDFGTFVVLPSCSGCTVTITSAGQRTPGAGILALNNNGKAAQFNATCNNVTCPFTVTTPAPVSIVAGGVTMTLTYSLTRTSTSTPSTITVAGVLTIPGPGPTPGAYPKTFTVLTSP